MRGHGAGRWLSPRCLPARGGAARGQRATAICFAAILRRGGPAARETAQWQARQEGAAAASPPLVHSLTGLMSEQAAVMGFGGDDLSGGLAAMAAGFDAGKESERLDVLVAAALVSADQCKSGASLSDCMDAGKQARG